MRVDVRRQRAEGCEDTAVVIVVGTDLETISLGYFQREFQSVDRIEPESRAEQRFLRIDIFGLHALEIERRDDHRRDVPLGTGVGETHGADRTAVLGWIGKKAAIIAAPEAANP